MINYTNMRIPKKYQKFIYEVDYDSNDGEPFYTLNLEECCCVDGEPGLIFYSTQAELLADLKNIEVMTEERYIRKCGEDGLDDFKESLERVMGE